MDQHRDEDEQDIQADRYRAPALDKGLDILEVLADQTSGLTRAEIVKEMGLNPSQIYRMLERLVARGYVARIEGGDRYALTMKLFLLGSNFPPLRRLVAQAQPFMDRFSRETRQSCHLVVPEQGVGIIVAQASPAGHWEFRARVGGQLDLFTTGSGLALLAFQDQATLPQTLTSWGVRDAESRLAGLGPQLAQVRQDGFRIAPSGLLVGVTDISLPVFGLKDEAIGVLTCAFIEHPDEQTTNSRELAQEQLVRVAREISISSYVA